MEGVIDPRAVSGDWGDFPIALTDLHKESWSNQYTRTKAALGSPREPFPGIVVTDIHHPAEYRRPADRQAFLQTMALLND